MERNLEAEIDDLKEQMSQLMGAAAAIMPTSEDDPDESGKKRVLQLRMRAEVAGNKGAVEYYGAYEAGGRGYLRTQDYLAVEDLLDMDFENVSKIIFSLGNRQRLLMLKAILEEPRTAAELVDLLSLGTSGQAYHHLKALQAADFVTQENNGKYAFRPHRVHAFLQFLAGAYDSLDQQYTSANLEELEEPTISKPT